MTARRQLLSGVFDNPTIKWVIIALCIVVGLLVIAFVIWAIVTKCGRGRSAAVAPETSAAANKVRPRPCTKALGLLDPPRHTAVPLRLHGIPRQSKQNEIRGLENQ